MTDKLDDAFSFAYIIKCKKKPLCLHTFLQLRSVVAFMEAVGGLV